MISCVFLSIQQNGISATLVCKRILLFMGGRRFRVIWSNSVTSVARSLYVIIAKMLNSSFVKHTRVKCMYIAQCTVQLNKYLVLHEYFTYLEEPVSLKNPETNRLILLYVGSDRVPDQSSTSHCQYRIVVSGRVEQAQKWSSASRICEYIVLNINIFYVEYHGIIEIVEYESGRVEYANIEVLGHSLPLSNKNDCLQ